MSNLEPSISFVEKLIKAGVIPETAISFRLTAEVNTPVVITISHYATTCECELITKTLEELLNEGRNA